MASYYKQWCWRQVESGNLNFLEECPYNRFRYAWYCFLQLLDIHYEEGFLCPICSDIPDIVVMDGVSLGIRKSFMPWGPSLFSSVDSVVYDGSSHNTRNFINNNETRQLLKKYIDKGLTYEEMMTLKKKVALYQPSLSPLLDYFFNNSDYISPHMYKDFFYLLSSNYPVCAFLHYSEDLFNILNNLETFSVDDMVLIERESPVISVLFKQLGWKIPENLKPIFRELVCKAKSPFNGQRHEVSRCDSNCNCTSKGFFPCLPKLCHRGNYVMDNKNKKRNSSCTKKRSTHPSLIPGLFTISCIHGICYGYDVMEDSESPNVPFTILRTRLHDGCHKGYNLDCYPQHRHINTQVAEQRNSTFKKLKSMLSEFGKL